MQYPILIIIADGWNRKAFFDCLNNNELPEIKNEFLSNSLLLANVLAVFPSVSLASHTTILSGKGQKEHHIVCHRWVNKAQKIKNFVGVDTLGINNDISKKISTVFELGLREKTYSIQSIISRGALEKIKIPTFNSAKILKKATEIICDNPDSVTVVWLPSCDALSHKFGPYSDRVKSEMMLVSKAMGKMIETLKTKKLYDKTKILFTSDHGFKEVKKRFDLKKLLSNLNYNVALNSKKYKVGINIYTNGDSVALLNLNLEKKDCQEIIKISDALINSEAVEFIVYRINNLHFKIKSKLGISSLEIINEEIVRYEIESGIDPLGLIYNSKEKIINYKNLTEEIVKQKYPDFINQFLESSLPESEIDMIVMSKRDYHFSEAPRLGYRFGYHRGSHGGASSDEMIFPAIIHSNDMKGVSYNPVRSKQLINILLDKK